MALVAGRSDGNHEPAVAAAMRGVEDPLRVLVVDDNVDLSRAICLMLEMCGHLAQAAHRADEVETAIKRFAPHVVVLDIGLPDRSGYEVAAELRALAGRANMAIIALSGSEEQCPDRGLFDGWLLKPVSGQGLLKAIATCTVA